MVCRFILSSCIFGRVVFRVELIGSLDHDISWAGGQVVGLQLSVNRAFDTK
jgi:hypothetical protein